MEKIIDGVLMAAYLTLLALGGHYSLRHAAAWSQRLALEKAHQGLGSLERSARIMTGGKLDY